uniref:bifunctional heparan sulfate N-deacetylase/N-sulfotransferase 4 n=1 Tax=Ciona intestinalis TaxID=7719 RepID=UPI000180BCFF|nr:bifunctional heparan sulfate N-deacetylase/N-sulfotransferase 4 [Ciona intestinalis]|eukprot:XP_002120286.1 bifunctional heparan sulfate N-deacetylase/N-sulfotransferase 4 [Ciona intestinalis]
MWMKLRKIASPRNVVITLCTLAAFSLFYAILTWDYNNATVRINPDSMPAGPVFNVDRWVQSPYEHDHSAIKPPSGMPARQKVLLFLHPKSTVGKGIQIALEFVRFKFQVQTGDIRNLPVLTDDNKGRYAVIVFEDLFMYLGLQSANRNALDKYCREYNVGMIFLLHYHKKPEEDPLLISQVGNFPLRYMTDVRLKDYEINETSPLLRITRPGAVVPLPTPNDWTVFFPYHHTYTAVTFASRLKPLKLRKGKRRFNRKHRNTRSLAFDSMGHGAADMEQTIENQEKLYPVILDRGIYDGIQRVFFGSTLKFFLNKIMFLDALSYLSYGRLSIPLERYFQIDIDDVFVGIPDTRLLISDVNALLNFQSQLRKNIPGFSFQLGFSGKFIYSGTDAESEADRMLLKMSDEFLWFPHMWSHMQAHWFLNATKLCDYMELNRQFAIRHNFNTSSHYAVAPHHAGVYPVHEQLYYCWKKIWNISSTSTEEYLSLRPDHKRRGFIHKNIMVLPRQTCGLFTHTMVLDMYPGGQEILLEIIDGGSLFQSFLYNQINVFMTHQSNYGNDRLGLFTFDREIKFIYKWTNLRLKYEPPMALARRYFNIYPEEREPLWKNPCAQRRHLEIWSEEKNCNSLPSFVVVGPQKTGTTALYWFLTMHPHVKSNHPSPTTFEEVQFFSGSNYFKGLDWYMSFFPTPENNTVIFEKSATYFDQQVVPKRLTMLLPSKHVVVVLIDPAKRAYSWYQHMRSHNDASASKYSFYETITAQPGKAPPALISLQRRCLDPGFYARHLENWLEYIQSQYIVIVDGDLLKSDPSSAMFNLQTDLGFTEIYQYDKILKFDKRKGFFCQLLPTGKTKCLGRGKGRQYPDMDQLSVKYLDTYYKESNTKLTELLRGINKPIPGWLSEKSVT